MNTAFTVLTTVYSHKCRLTLIKTTAQKESENKEAKLVKENLLFNA